MKKLRTASQLQDALDADFAWRLKEVDDIRKEVRRAESIRQRSLLRAGVPLLYAHWEGFVKNGADSYINYLSCQGLRYRNLKHCFIVLGLKHHLTQLVESRKSHRSVETVAFMMQELDKPARLPMQQAVNTEANLSAAVFENLTGWIGIDIHKYKAKFNLIDEKLLKQRNQIAHGEFLLIDHSGFESLVDEVIQLLRLFKSDLETAIQDGSHLAA
jgi:hypothetical protein